MTQQESNNIITKTVRGILIILIPTILVGWGGTYVMVRVALERHEVAISNVKKRSIENEKEVKNLNIRVNNVWYWLLEHKVERGDTEENKEHDWQQTK